jgi:bisphosphoglycerate-dependent phosphoglycerate mutase
MALVLNPPREVFLELVFTGLKTAYDYYQNTILPTAALSGNQALIDEHAFYLNDLVRLMEDIERELITDYDHPMVVMPDPPRRRM